MIDRLRQLFASDVPFARDDATRLLPAMIACMTGFVALLLALAMCLTNGLSSQSQSVIGSIQVEVPRTKVGDGAFMEKISDTITKTPGVESVTTLSESEMETLLKPWLGNDFTLKDLPVPVLIDVKTRVKDKASAVDVKALRATLKKIDAGIRVEDRGPWVGHMVRAAALLKGLALLVATLLVLCILGMIILVARTSLRLHFKTVSLLHIFGATDEYILRQFQWNNAWLAGRGALMGVVFAALVFGTAVLVSARLASPVMPAIDLSAMHVVVFLLLPIFTGAIALIATRLTVKSMLEHMP